MGIWYSAIGYVTIISPLINYGLGQVTGALASWKYMYIVAGVMTTLWAFVILFFLPPDPTRAKGLSAREKYIAVSIHRWSSPMLLH
jgi:predicted MFS family arabinose efflux permease